MHGEPTALMLPAKCAVWTRTPTDHPVLTCSAYGRPPSHLGVPDVFS